MSASTLDKPSRSTGDLSTALERCLSAPLRAVELALDHIACDLGGLTRERLVAPRSALATALRQSEAAVELLAQRPLHADRCSLRELVCSARAALPAAQRARVWVASEPTEDDLHVDSTLLVQALAALISRAAEQPEAEVLVHAHQDGQLTTFAVVDDLGARGDALQELETTPDTPALLLARAHLARLGAELGEHSAGPHRCVTITLTRDPLTKGCPR